ncbi:hypothetical protein A2U01_0007983 [Trifolium medium]|uniref:Uncharacterized protein n=1 Tax=Trifolium medium TaxID=97028 RepID=A0A392MK67_9FABA|nr:hypothetical protein [Trifolium medium]
MIVWWWREKRGGDDCLVVEGDVGRDDWWWREIGAEVISVRAEEDE